MTRSGQARKFARKTLKKTGSATRRVMFVQMLLYTLIIAAVTAAYELNSRGILKLDTWTPWLMPLLLPCAMFLLALVNLLINVPLTAIARKTNEGAFSRMNFGRVLIAILLAILPAAAFYGVIQLADLINTQWKPIFDWALASNIHIVLSCAAVVGGLLIILYVCGVIGVFSRQFMLYMADCPDKLKGSSVGQIVRNGFAHAFAPVLLVIRSLFWFLLLLILTAALVGVACYFFTPVQITFKDTLANIAASFYLAMTLLPTWAIGSIIVLGAVWVLGLGLVFWPRFSMMRLYYHRLIMRDTDVM